MHDQTSMLELYVHRASGISLTLCGIFKVISDFSKQFTLLYILFGLLGIFMFWSGAEYFVVC